MSDPRPRNEIEIPHLSGPAAMARQVLAAHFVSGFSHIVEIGGHFRPITPFLYHGPQSVLVVDPKVEPYEAEELHGKPCRVRHVAAKFQQLTYQLPRHRYGLVFVGYSLKPYGGNDPIGEQLFELVDNAGVVVLEYPPAYGRSAGQAPQILERDTMKKRCSIELTLDDAEIAGSPYARRLLTVLDPVITHSAYEG